jgi:hypothetical protein
MVVMRIEAEQPAERAIARQLERFGCRVQEEGPTSLRVEFPCAESEREALAETRLYLGMRIRSVRSVSLA